MKKYSQKNYFTKTVYFNIIFFLSCITLKWKECPMVYILYIDINLANIMKQYGGNASQMCLAN